MEKSFNPLKYQKEIYNNWLDKGYFKTSAKSKKKPFTIVMPPPNITDKLHVGHAYDASILDSITRYKRMQGFEALLVPGTDHAALATETKVVELLRTQGTTKEELGREKFLQKMQEWYDKYGDLILGQLKLMGLSCDWDKFAFTMDEKRSYAVRYAFVSLYKKGLIYQGNRITNWCVKCKTALSDIEVEHEEHNDSIYHIKYKLSDSNDFITVATTRPETMLGDTAIAVNPNDDRYKNYIGKSVVVPFIDRTIPIIADDYVDASFGTGAVKITPAHDPNDFEVGQRHGLESILVTNEDGTMNNLAGKYAGLDRIECRKQIIKDAKDTGILVKVEQHKNNVGHCQRCGEVVEPIISKQWFVKMQPLAVEAIRVVKENEIKFIPKRNEKVYLNWMENIKDWCISRQIWSGHRIPVFTCEDCNEVMVELEDPKVCTKCNSKKISQQTDSLDTWFSSALWPFSTLGWPEETPEFKYFYPTNLMVTGYDIIFFWVARMIFSALEHTGKIPFNEVLLHGLIRDNSGRKMSKSLGNGIDPTEVIDRYGTDALRYALLNGSAIGMDSKVGYDKFDNASNFLNKLWNASKFVTENIKKGDFTFSDIQDTEKDISTKWILHELNLVIKDVVKAYDKYNLGLVCNILYEFIWNKFCDWYIEISKIFLHDNNKTIVNNCLNHLVYILSVILKMFHPIAPFITEVIYSYLPKAEGQESIMIQDFPKYNKKFEFADDYETMSLAMDIIKKVRNLRAELNVASNVKINLFVLPLTKNAQNEIIGEIIKKLATCKDLEFINSEQDAPENSSVCVNDIFKIFVPTSDLIDKPKEIERLNLELSKTDDEIKRANNMLSNSNFVNRAPAELVESEKAKIIKYNQIKENIIKELEKLK